jgi:hypothetical protein
VEVEEYDGEALRTDRGIADVGFALASWIIGHDLDRESADGLGAVRPLVPEAGGTRLTL